MLVSSTSINAAIATTTAINQGLNLGRHGPEAGGAGSSLCPVPTAGASSGLSGVSAIGSLCRIEARLPCRLTRFQSPADDLQDSSVAQKKTPTVPQNWMSSSDSATRPLPFNSGTALSRWLTDGSSGHVSRLVRICLAAERRA